MTKACELVNERDKLDYNIKYLQEQYSRWHKEKYSVSSATSKSVFSPAREAGLVGVLNALHFNQAGMTPSDVIELVREQERLGDSWDGWSWWRGFLRRQPDLAIRTASESTPARSNVAISEVELFIEMLNKLYNEYSFPSTSIFNCDETIWFLKRGEIMRKVVGTSDEKAHLKESRAQDSCSSLVFVSADGTGFLNCIILRSGKSSTRPSKKKVSDDDDDEPDEGEQERYDEAVANELELDEDLENEPQQIDGEALDNALKTVKFADITRLVARSKRRSGFLHTAVFFTPTGRTNNAMFANAFNLFVRLYKAHVGDEHDKVARVNALLLLDNLGAHKVRDALDAILAAAEQQVHCRFLPTNTTHFAQPLDALVFASLKRFLALLARRRQRYLTLSGRAASYLVVPLLRIASEMAVTPAVVRSAFERSFMWPWNPNGLLAAARKNNGIADPSPSKRTSLVMKEAIEYARTAAASELQKAKSEPDVRVVKADVVDNVYYSAFDLVGMVTKKADEDAAALAAKAAKKSGVVEKKRKRDEEQDAQRLAKMSTVNFRIAQTIAKVCLNCRAKLDVTENDCIGCESCDVTWCCKTTALCAKMLDMHETYCKTTDNRKKPELLRTKLF